MQCSVLPCSVLQCREEKRREGKGREGQRSMGNSVDPREPCTVMYLNIDPTTFQA